MKKLAEPEFIDGKVTDFLSRKSRNNENYTIENTALFMEVLEKIVADDNVEDSVAVIDPTSSRTVIGLISDMDILRHLFNHPREDRTHIIAEQLMNATTNDQFFHVNQNDTLRDALRVMNTHKSDHVIVLDDEKEYIGWVNRHTIFNKLKHDVLIART